MGLLVQERGFLYDWVGFETPLVTPVHGGPLRLSTNRVLANIPPSARGIASSSSGQKTAPEESSGPPILVRLLEFLVVALRSWGHVVPFLIWCKERSMEDIMDFPSGRKFKLICDF